MSENPNLIIYFALGFVILMRLMRRVQKWKSFSNKWLIELAQKQFPDDLSLNDAIKDLYRMNGNVFLQVPKGKENEPEWTPQSKIELIDEEIGRVHLNRLADGRIYSIELPDQT
jgi:hypothetical protein